MIKFEDFTTDITQTIVPDTYGSGLCYEVRDGFMDKVFEYLRCDTDYLEDDEEVV